MKKSAMAATALLLAGLSATAAFAKAVTGIIASVDKKGDAITLTDGTTFTLPEGIEAETLKAGEKVVVTYTTKGGKVTVSSIHAAQ